MILYCNSAVVRRNLITLSSLQFDKIPVESNVVFLQNMAAIGSSGSAKKQGSITGKVLTGVSQQCINDCITNKPRHVYCL